MKMFLNSLIVWTHPSPWPSKLKKNKMNSTLKGQSSDRIQLPIDVEIMYVIKKFHKTGTDLHTNSQVSILISAYLKIHDDVVKGGVSQLATSSSPNKILRSTSRWRFEQHASSEPRSRTRLVRSTSMASIWLRVGDEAAKHQIKHSSENCVRIQKIDINFVYASLSPSTAHHTEHCACTGESKRKTCEYKNSLPKLDAVQRRRVDNTK